MYVLILINFKSIHILDFLTILLALVKILLKTNFFIISHQCIGQNHRSKSVLGFRMAASSLINTQYQEQ